MKSLVALIFASLISTHALASASVTSSSCAHLKQDLKSMHKAQQTVMTSLVNNHESFAGALEEYATAVEKNMIFQKEIAHQMEKSAQAFRRRGVQGKKMTAEFNSATADLLARVAACL